MTNVWLTPIAASDVMTRNVTTVGPDTPTRAAAKLLLAKGFSAVPVVGSEGVVVGIVSEGDLMAREMASRAPRRAWLLELLAEGEDLAPEFTEYLKAADRPVRDIMTSPVVTVSEDTPVQAIAQILQERHIKRVPVVRNGRIVGIVSRADLVRALAQSPKPGSAGARQKGEAPPSSHGRS